MTNMGKNGENTGGRHNKWTETAEAAGLLFGAHAGWRSLLAAPGDTAAAWMRFGGFAVWAGLGGGWAPTPRPWIHTFQPDMATRAYLPKYLPKYLWSTQIKKSRCAGSS